MTPEPLPRPFRASVVREFRQHGVWAGAVAAALSAFLAFLLYVGRESGQSMAGALFKTGEMIVFAVLGLTFGLALMLGELPRGRWGFLVLRPLARRRLFAAKFVAGAAMYLIVTTLAIAVAAGFAHSPRFARAPFSAALLLPSIYFQSCGLAWLACGLLIAVRDASWVGTRLYPLAITGLTLALIYAESFSFAASVGTVLLLTAALAASGAQFFAANGEYEPQPRWAKPLAFGVIFSGGLVLLTTGVDQAAGAVWDAIGPAAPRLLIETHYGLDAFGQPFRFVRYNNGTPGEGVAVNDGRIQLSPPDYQDRSFVGGVTLRADNPYDTDRARARAAQKSFLDEVTLSRDRYDNFREAVVYVFVRDRRTLEAYDYDNNYLGGVGPHGFYDATAAQERFPLTSRVQDGAYRRLAITSNDTVWRIDLDRRKVEVIFRADADGPILDAAESRGMESAFVCVLTPRRVYAVPVPREMREPTTDWDARVRPTEPTPGPVRSLELPEARPGGRVILSIIGKDGLVALTDPDPGEAVRPMVTRTLNGRLTHRLLPPLPPTFQPPTLTERGPVAGTLPPVFLPLTQWPRAAAGRAGLLTVAPTLAVLATLLMARRRRFDRRTTGVWIALSVLLGLHAPLTLLGLRRRPALIPCPACGKPRVVDRDECEHCGAAFPPPGDPATAVFEDAGRAVA